MDPQAVNEDVEVISDDFKRIMFYKGPVVSNIIDDESGNPEVEELYLRSQLEHSRNMRFFLVVHDYYEGDWRGFDQAYDSDGNKFHALSVRHKVKCKLICGYEEVLEVELDKTYLNKHLKEGLYFRLYGPAGTSSSSFHLPGPYIQGFLKGAYVP
jgi:hypothetical protein